ncbi:MAG: hypothetical protein WAZ98_05240 [Cyclobacteriaceae bacterium]
MKTILSIIACLFSLTVLAQTATKAAPSTTPKAKVATCYDQWYAVFKERGASPIADGTHEVIISLRNEYDYAECFMGKIDVKDGRLAGKLQIQKVDGSYEDFQKKVSSVYQNADGVVKEELRDITNGMSEALELGSGERIRLFFYKSVGVKEKANKKAPAPAALIKN